MSAILSTQVEAHPLAPSLLQLTEQDDIIQFVWKTPIDSSAATLFPVLPQGCRLQVQSRNKMEGQASVIRGTFICDQVGLAGQTIRVANLETSVAAVLVRHQPQSGNPFSALLHASNPKVSIPSIYTKRQIVWDYIEFGCYHLLQALDHILFLLAAIVLVQSLRSLVILISCFTLGHSISLALTTLTVFAIATQLIEILIAASITVMALTIYRRKDLNAVPLGRGGLIATLFGVLHGLGFSSSLTLLGLPRDEIPIALLSFNLGIEIGQLVMIGLGLLVISAIKNSALWSPRASAAAYQVIVYVLGGLSMYLLIDRTFAWVI